MACNRKNMWGATFLRSQRVRIPRFDHQLNSERSAAGKGGFLYAQNTHEILGGFIMTGTIYYDPQAHTLKADINNCPITISFTCSDSRSSIWHYVFLALANGDNSPFGPFEANLQ